MTRPIISSSDSFLGMLMYLMLFTLALDKQFVYRLFVHMIK